MTEVFTEGRNERPDAAGIVRRGEAAEYVRGYTSRFGEAPLCFVGFEPEAACDSPAVMEVYGLSMCEAHGEESASGALEEISYDLENELQRPMNSHVRSLSPHVEAALRHGFESLSAEAADTDQRDGDLLRAFPLDRDRVYRETLAFIEDPDGNGRRERGMPSDAWRDDRLLICRHMRLAFEERATWLVEMLEKEREAIARQTAYAVALEKEAGLA